MSESMDIGNEDGSALKRRRQEGSTVPGGDMFPIDRISSLPESIISHILSLLPTKSAVVTSFLSKGWKLRWTKTTAFDLDDKLWPPDDESESLMTFVKFVNMVFLSSTEPIHKLHLQWQCRKLQPIYTNIWLNSAIARNIRDLSFSSVNSLSNTLRHRGEDYEFQLPAALYTCATLEALKLIGPFVVKPPNVVRLPKLAVLKLIFVKFECQESVEKLLSACPVLHSLNITRLHHHSGMLLCKVSSPSLKHLYIALGVCKTCAASDMKLVIDTPALEHLSINGIPFSEITCVQHVMPVNELKINAACDGAVGLVRACDGAKVVILGGKAMVALSRGMTPLPATATFGRLTKLIVGLHRSHCSELLNLIDRCIKLQVLDIVVYGIRDVDRAKGPLESLGGSYWRHPICVPGCFSSSLKHVYFGEFKGAEDEMAMLKLLLDYGSLIQRVTLTFNGDLSCEQKLKIHNEVSMLSRASSTCKISFS